MILSILLLTYTYKLLLHGKQVTGLVVIVVVLIVTLHEMVLLIG